MFLTLEKNIFQQFLLHRKYTPKDYYDALSISNDTEAEAESCNFIKKETLAQVLCMKLLLK